MQLRRAALFSLVLLTAGCGAVGPEQEPQTLYEKYSFQTDQGYLATYELILDRSESCFGQQSLGQGQEVAGTLDEAGKAGRIVVATRRKEGGFFAGQEVTHTRMVIDVAGRPGGGSVVTVDAAKLYHYFSHAVQEWVLAGSEACRPRGLHEP